MPELPEIEHLRRSLESSLVGAKVRRAVAHRRDVIRLGRPFPNEGSKGPGRAPAMGTALLRGDRIDRLERRGKQLAIIGRSAGVICVHLGMSGQLRLVGPRTRVEPNTHIHVRWWLEGKDGREGQLVFRDPRRFGGIWTFPDQAVLDEKRWSRLGPDALTIRRAEVANALRRTSRPLKTALLDQSLIAGLGNIYVDEILFRSGLHPQRRANRVSDDQLGPLHRSIRRILGEAIKAGGSTLRDYADSRGRPGRYTARHLVYGRAGLPCRNCRTLLEQLRIAQRTTVVCPRCQPV